MSLGLGRHLFDELMADAKRRHGVPKKALLEPLQMQELAQRYRALLDDHGLQVVDDPFEQLLACIGLVHRSWHSEHARLYRRALHIAEEWETGVLVQKMVFGNLDVGAGTGVLLTRHPRHESGSREPYGDFVVQGQGDDVVAGLVETHPITESQRRREATHSPLSLERDFPAIYGELAAMARTLVQDHGMNHQEIEFTFESPRPADLFILQTRDTVLDLGLAGAYLRALAGARGRQDRGGRRRRRRGAQRPRGPHRRTTSRSCAGVTPATTSSSSAATPSPTTSR